MNGVKKLVLFSDIQTVHGKCALALFGKDHINVPLMNSIYYYNTIKTIICWPQRLDLSARDITKFEHTCVLACSAF